MNENCIFCKINKGEIPSFTLYEDEKFKVFMDISPATKGHVVIIPRKHIENIFEMDDETASEVLIVAKKIAKAMKEELKCEGLNILQNNGAVAGQTVFHFHIHLIPRYTHDSVHINWNSESYKEGEAVEIAKAIGSKIQ